MFIYTIYLISSAYLTTEISQQTTLAFPRSMEAMSRVVRPAGARTQEQLHATWTLGFPQYFQTNTICD